MLLILLSAISVGAAIGLSVGHAGLDSTVLAAVLPVIITGVAGGAAAAVFRINGNRQENSEDSSLADRDRKAIVVAAWVVIVFSTTYLAGVYVGINLETKWSSQNALAFDRYLARERENAVARRYDYVKRCTEELNRLNAIRQKANDEGNLVLEPLTVEQVCIALPNGASGETPLVSLAGVTELAPLSLAKEGDHYQFLESCSLEQAAAILEYRNQSGGSAGGLHANGGGSMRTESDFPPEDGVRRGSGSIDIGRVCPALAVPAYTLGDRDS